MDPLTSTLLFSIGFILFGFGAIAWFVLEVTHKIKSHGSSDGLLIIIALCALFVGMAGVVGYFMYRPKK